MSSGLIGIRYLTFHAFTQFILVSGIEKNDLEKLKAYALYSGMKNYRNLFLYANGILTGKTDIEL